VTVAAAISVDGVSKTYRLYHERNQSLKGAVMSRARVRYESFPALDDVSLEIPAGETFGLIGENGCGKSTLLKCIARILNPDAGSIHTEGKISALLELGAGFHPELSGRDNVYLNGAILGLSRKQLNARFDDIVGFAGLEHFIDTPVKNYSSGMYVRLGFSVAINVDPDILLVDEVLAVGDEEFQRRCSEKFAELKHSGKTVVIVSHALGSVRNLCDEVALLEHGKLLSVGPAGEVIDGYLAEVHVDRVKDGEYGSRWGSGEGKVERVELLGADGAPATEIHTGGPLTLRLHYAMSEPIPQPVFGVAIQTLEGFTVTGPNTRQAGAVPDQLSGTGHVDLRVDRLMLAPGTYDLSVSLYDYSCSHAFDFRYRTLRFDVQRGDPAEEHGVMALGGEWEGAVNPVRR
jgi:ABC-2 type transport system ATP-binding protein